MELQRPPRAGFKRKGFVMKEVQSPKKPLIYYTGFGPVISLISGTLMLVNPWFSWLSVRYIISFYLILLGVDCIALAFSRIGSKF